MMLPLGDGLTPTSLAQLCFGSSSGPPLQALLSELNSRIAALGRDGVSSASIAQQRIGAEYRANEGAEGKGRVILTFRGTKGLAQRVALANGDLAHDLASLRSKIAVAGGLEAPKRLDVNAAGDVIMAFDITLPESR